MRFIYFLFLFFVITQGKSIEDPVAKHDANQCATYLCGSMPVYATKYLQSGCNGQFSDFVKLEEENENIQKVESELNVLLLYQKNNEKNIIYENNVNQMVVILLGILSGFFSLTVGYMCGKSDFYNINIKNIN